MKDNVTVISDITAPNKNPKQNPKYKICTKNRLLCTIPFYFENKAVQ